MKPPFLLLISIDISQMHHLLIIQAINAFANVRVLYAGLALRNDPVRFCSKYDSLGRDAIVNVKESLEGLVYPGAKS